MPYFLFRKGELIAHYAGLMFDAHQLKSAESGLCAGIADTDNPCEKYAVGTHKVKNLSHILSDI